MKTLLNLLTIVILAVALTGCASLSNTASPAKPLKPIKPKYRVEQIWSHKVSSGSDEYKLHPSYANGNIYTVGAQGKVVASSAKKGNTVWTQSLNAPINSGTSSNSQYVAVASRRGMLYVLNAKSGTLLWKKMLSDEALASPEVWKKTILVKTIDGNLTAYNAKTGAQNWVYNNGAPGLELEASSMPQVAGTTVVAGFSNGHVVALNLKSGSVLWNKAIAMASGMTAVQRLVGVDVTPLIQDGSVYAATYQGNIVSLNLTNGQTFWHHKMSSHSGLIAGPSRVFISATNGVIWAYDSLSGGIDWQQDDLQDRNVTGPAVMKNTVLVADSAGVLNWLSKDTGAFVARAYAKSAVITAPLVVNNTAYVLSTNGYLSAYKLS